MEYSISYDSGSSCPFAVIGYPYLTFSLHAAGGLEVCEKKQTMNSIFKLNQL